MTPTEIRTIKRLHPVERIEVRGNSTTVHLAPIKPYGRYRIRINTKTERIFVYLDRPLRVRENGHDVTLHHPFGENGSICFGNLEGMAYRLLAESDIPMIVCLIIEFLQFSGRSAGYDYSLFSQRWKRDHSNDRKERPQ